MSRQVCENIRRQGQNAGIPCGNLVTALDPNNRYCCHHYRRVLVPAAALTVSATATAATAATTNSPPASPGDQRAILTELHLQLMELAAKVEAALAQQ